MARALGESCHLDLLAPIPFMMESVREAGSGCWPSSFEMGQDWRVRELIERLPTGTAVGSSGPLNGPPIYIHFERAWRVGGGSS